MFQIDVPSAVATQPAATGAGTAGYFTDGNPSSGQQATIVPAEFLNATMMELLNILSAAGLNPNKSTYNQVVTAIKTLLQQGGATYALDTGTANTYQAAYTPAVTALGDGMKLRFKAKTANTGASTFTPNGMAASPIYGAAHSALQGGEIQPNSDIELIWNSSLNSGNGAWVILESTGGAVQIGLAQQSSQAVTLGQLMKGGGTNANQASATSVATSVSFTAPQKGIVFLFAQGYHQSANEQLNLSVSNALQISYLTNFATILIGVAQYVGTVAAGAAFSATATITTSGAAGACDVGMMYMFFPTP